MNPQKGAHAGHDANALMLECADDQVRTSGAI